MLKIAWSKQYVLPLPPNHRFPMSKYEILPEQLIHEGTITDSNLFAPAPLEERHLLKAHTASYWERLRTLSLTPREVRRTGFPLSQLLIDREVIIAEGTRRLVDYAIQYQVAMNIAGGTHHAFADRGEGFCLLNDMAIGAHYLLSIQPQSRILIVDLDVHQGNGTAEIFRDEPRVFTFSMHGANNYPLVKEKSDLDIPLPDFTDDKTYLHQLDHHLNTIVDQFQPSFIFYQSGVDILATDKLGRLSVSPQGCRERDRFVLQTCKRHRVPILITMGGGYSPNFRDIIEAHANTYRLAQEIFF